MESKNTDTNRLSTGQIRPNRQSRLRSWIGNRIQLSQRSQQNSSIQRFERTRERECIHDDAFAILKESVLPPRGAVAMAEYRVVAFELRPRMSSEWGDHHHSLL
jgi:hypothetical protein